MRHLRWLFSDAVYLRAVDRGEEVLAKLLGAILLLVIIVASLQLGLWVFQGLLDPGTVWIADRFNTLLGDLLILLIGLEVLQNLTAYLRHRSAQIELVLLTAITAVARKVIVLPQGGDHKPELLVGLGVAVLCFSGAYVLVRGGLTPRLRPRTEPARSFRGPDPSPPGDGDAVD